MTSRANPFIGLVDLPTLADPLSAAGFRVVGGGAFREAAAEIKSAVEQGPIAAIIVADHPQPGIKAWLTRMASHGAVVVIVRSDVPRLDVDAAASVDLPATVAELLAAAGLTASSPSAGAVHLGLDGEVMLAVHAPARTAPAAPPVAFTEPSEPLPRNGFHVADSAPVADEPAQLHRELPAWDETDPDRCAPEITAPAVTRLEVAAPNPVSDERTDEPTGAREGALSNPWGDEPARGGTHTPGRPFGGDFPAAEAPAPVAAAFVLPDPASFTGFDAPAPEHHAAAGDETNGPGPAEAGSDEQAPFKQFKADPIKFARELRAAREAAKAEAEAEERDADGTPAVPPLAAAPANPAPPIRVAATPWDDLRPTGPTHQSAARPAPEPVRGPTPAVIPHTPPAARVATPWDEDYPTDPPPESVSRATVAPFELPPATDRDEEWFGAQPAAAPTAVLTKPAVRSVPAPILTTPAYQPAPEPAYTEPAHRPAPQAPAYEVPAYEDPQAAVEAMFAADAPAETAPRPQPRRIRGHGSPLAIVCAEKGGVGKTNTALGLCQRAADLAPNKRVVLIDMNRGQGDVRKYLKLGGAQVPSILDAAISGNIADAVLSPEQVTAARHASLPPISFGVVLAPEPEAADPRIVTPDVYQRVIDLVRDQADLVVIDTQIIEIHDTSGLVDGLIVPTLAHDAYGVTLTDTSAPGVSNLVTMLGYFAQQGVPANRLMIVINRALAGYDTNVLRGMLSKYGTFAGAIEEKSQLARQANMGRIPHNDVALAGVLDAVLLRVTGWPCFQPVPVTPAKKKRFSFARKGK